MASPAPRVSSLAPPRAKQIAHVVTLHGDVRQDEYAWLRDREDPQVLRYLEAENEYAERIMAGTEALQETLNREMLARIQQSDLSVPYLESGWLYYSRTEEGRQYPIYCRKRPAPDAPEQIVLDLNQLAEGHPFLGLGAFEVSDDGSRLAYSVDHTGFRVYQLRVRDLERGQDLPDTAHDVGSVAWAADGETLLYTVKDAAKREHRLFRRRLGDPDATQVHEEPDERFSLQVSRSRSGAFLFLASESLTTRDVRFLAADQPGEAWTPIGARRQDHELHADHRGDSFYLLTNDRGRNFRLVEAPVRDPARWNELLPEREHVMLEGVDCFAEHLVIQEREDGLMRLVIRRFAAAGWDAIQFPEPVYAAGLGANRTFATRQVRYVYQSFVTPPSTYDYDVDTRTSTLLKRQPVLGGYDPARYQTARLHATAPDGASIPISMVWKRDVTKPAPLLLYAYGAYGHSLSASFSSNRFSLLDRGAVFAIAHVRGGGELGQTWHDQGRMEHKPNTFTDFIAAAEYLIACGWTRADRLAIHGGSAGGLTMAAVINLRPELFHAALLQVPFVDVINTMSDESLPLTVGEFEEWGNPAIAEHYARMKAYCPYTNLSARDYPRMLVRAALHDSQVMVWEAAKYVARLRRLKQDAHPLIFKVNLSAGHGGASGRYDFLREIAFDYAFLLTQWGLEPPR